MIDIEQARRNFSKDISNLTVLVQHAADTTLHGSFSERRPDLGKMYKCVFCGVRRRATSVQCCNPRYATAILSDGTEEPWENKDLPKSFRKRIFHKRHGQSRAWKIKQLAAIFSVNEGPFPHVPFYNQALYDACTEMHVNVPAPEHIGIFAEKFWHWRQARIARAARLRAKVSRRNNRGN